MKSRAEVVLLDRTHLHLYRATLTSVGVISGVLEHASNANDRYPLGEEISIPLNNVAYIVWRNPESDSP